MTENEIKEELLNIQSDNVTLKEIKNVLNDLITKEKEKKKEIKKKEHSISTNEKVSEFDIKENRDKVFSDIDKILNDFLNQNKSQIEEIRNDGFVLGGGKRHIYLDNVAFTGRVYDTTNEPITTNSKLSYELYFRTNSLFVKMSTFSAIVSDIAKYFNIDNFNYTNIGIAGAYRKISKDVPNGNINLNYINLDIDINKKEILVTYNNTKKEIRYKNVETKMEKELNKLGITTEEFDDALSNESGPIWEKLKTVDLSKLMGLSVQLIN